MHVFERLCIVQIALKRIEICLVARLSVVRILLLGESNFGSVVILGDNKLKVNAVNISETLRYEILKGFTANAVLGFNHSEAVRNIKSIPIDFYQ